METTTSISVCFLTPLLHSIIVKIEEELNMSLSLGYFHTSMNLLKANLKNQPFAYHFDKTTSNQDKKTIRWLFYLLPSSAYCGSFCIGKCTADYMVVHFHEPIRKASLNPNFILSLGMDGSYVNLLFQNKLRHELSVIDIGTCPLYIVNSAFEKANKSLKESAVNLDETTIGFYFISFSNTLLPIENSTLQRW